MSRSWWISVLKWGFLLWLFGYVLGFVLFMIVPYSLIGWVIMPIGTVTAVWVLVKKIGGKSLVDYAKVGVVWVLIAVMLDYFLLVQLMKPEGGYYKLDVYMYYLITLGLPIVVGWYTLRQTHVADTHETV